MARTHPERPHVVLGVPAPREPLPGELAADPLYGAVRAVADGTDLLRDLACKADAEPATVRWSYRRDFGRVRLLMVDTRAARVLDEQNRSMLDPGEERWLREQALDTPESCDHLLIGTSLPWLLPHLVHDAEAWDAALCKGARGERWARFGEKLRRGADLEHWAAFPESFDALTDLVAEAGSGPDAPATVCVLSGDVHHAYVAEPTWPDGESSPRARVLQLTCSPCTTRSPRPSGSASASAGADSPAASAAGSPDTAAPGAPRSTGAAPADPGSATS